MGAHILVIEDNEASLDLMAYLLNAFGHTTIAARDGGLGLVRARAGGVDLILCDIQLPKMDGLAIARAIRSDAQTASVPLVAVTALTSLDDEERILAAGFDGWIAKPTAPERFVGQVELFLPASLRCACVRTSVPGPGQRVDSWRSRRSTHVLVVDDAVANVTLTRSVLEPCGYRVSTASSVEAALSSAAAAPPDLILADLCMPQKNGLDLLAAVKRDPALDSIPFVMISSAPATDQERAVAVAHGACGFILRPIEPAVFIDEIEDCLRKF
jgi:two-component system cell cycle response regulator